MRVGAVALLAVIVASGAARGAEREKKAVTEKPSAPFVGTIWTLGKPACLQTGTPHDVARSTKMPDGSDVHWVDRSDYSTYATSVWVKEPSNPHAGYVTLPAGTEIAVVGGEFVAEDLLGQTMAFAAIFRVREDGKPDTTTFTARVKTTPDRGALVAAPDTVLEDAKPAAPR